MRFVTYLRVFGLLTIICLPSSFSSTPGEEQDDIRYENPSFNKNILVKGVYANNQEEAVAVIGVAYVISPDEDQSLFLTLSRDELRLNLTKTTNSLFYFETVPDEEKHFSLFNLGIRPLVYNGAKKKCRIRIESKDQSNHRVQLLFKEVSDDTRPLFLQYDRSTSRAVLQPREQNFNSVWTLKPIYSFIKLKPKNVDSDTFLFKLSRREDLSQQHLSGDQVLALYGQIYSQKTLKRIYQTEDFIFAAMPELPYIEGLLITGAYPLKISNLENFWIGKGRSSKEAQHHPTLAEQDSIELQRGEVGFLKPAYEQSAQSLLEMGKVQITPGSQSWWGTTSYDQISVKIKSIVDRQYTPLPTCGVTFDGDTLSFIETNKNIITHPGTFAYQTDHLLQSALERAGREGKSISKILAKSVESSSLHAKEALIESFQNLSGAIKQSANRLERSLNEASHTFAQAIKEISQTSKSISAEMTNSLRRTSVTLKEALETASQNLATGATDVSIALKESSYSFEQAFTTLSHALEGSTNNIEQSVKLASRSFLEGMSKVEGAAMRMQNMHHQVEIGGGRCLVS